VIISSEALLRACGPRLGGCRFRQNFALSLSSAPLKSAMAARTAAPSKRTYSWRSSIFRTWCWMCWVMLRRSRSIWFMCGAIRSLLLIDPPELRPAASPVRFRSLASEAGGTAPLLQKKPGRTAYANRIRKFTISSTSSRCSAVRVPLWRGISSSTRARQRARQE
jgi:hypothetical protein